MAITAEQLETFRRMIAEPGSSTYTDETLMACIEKRAVHDLEGRPPDDSNWVETYDFNYAAADIWIEKASSLCADYDFSADGGSFQRSQAYQHALQMYRFYLARRKPRALTMQREKPDWMESTSATNVWSADDLD